MKKQPIAVIIADTHLKEENTEVNKLIFIQARQLASKLKLDCVYHAGDIFHSRKSQVIPNLSAFEDILDDYEKGDYKLVVIPGNHDKVSYKSENSYLDPFKHHPALELIRIPKLVVDSSIQIYMAPFFEDQEYVNLIQEALVMGIKKCSKVLITHIGLDGGIMNSGVIYHSKVNEKLFNGFDLVLSGHWHDPCQYGKVKYIGASLQHNFGEKPIKGATVLYDDLSTELVPFKFPQYLAYEIDVNEMKIKDIEDFKKEAEKSGDHLRVVLTGKEADIRSFDKQRLLNVGVDVTTKQEAINKEEVEESVVAFTDNSILQAFNEFCCKNELDGSVGCKYLMKALC